MTEQPTSAVPPSVQSRQTMSEDLSNESVGARLLSDDMDAWTHVYEEIFPKAREIIHRKYGPDRRWWSADDAIASACRTTYRRLKAGLRKKGLNSWEDLRRLLVAVASNKIIDKLRKTEVEGRWLASAYADAERAEVKNAKVSSFLKQHCAAEWLQAMHEAMKTLEGSLQDAVELLIFRGKLEGSRAGEIAERIEAETGERMTKFMVNDIWSAMRDRFKYRFPKLLDDSPDL